MPDRAIDQLRKQLDADYSYLDVLALALAKSGITTFTGDSIRWSQLIHVLRQDYPDALHGIWFSERGYSEQLEEFFRIMARAGALSFPNPRYERIDMPPAAAASIAADAPRALREQEELITAIAERLTELKYD